MEAFGCGRGSFSLRLTACAGVGLMLSAALAPSALAAQAAAAPISNRPAVPDTRTAAPVSASAAPARRATEADEIPALWLPREVALVDAPDPRAARLLFDGDSRTALHINAHGKRSIRIDLGGTRALVGLSFAGVGALSATALVEDSSGRHGVAGLGATALSLVAPRWAQAAATSPVRARALIVELETGNAPADLSELAIWALGPARDATDQSPFADRLALGVPANAVEAASTPDEAVVGTEAANAPRATQFTVSVDRDPVLLGRAFLVYELDHLAHWTGAQRAINGRALRGGYRAGARGVGGLQVEEISPAWLRRGDNAISFKPAARDGGLSYRVRHVRIIGMPRLADPAAPEATRTVLEDGNNETAVSGSELRRLRLASSSDAQPAYFTYYVDRAGSGALSLSAWNRRTRERGELRIELGDKTVGWHTVALSGALPPAGGVDVVLRGVREGSARVAEARVISQPALSGDELAVAYPLHGECVDHEAYVRGFVRGDTDWRNVSIDVNRARRTGVLDGDGSFAAIVHEPSAARGKPWSVTIDVTAPDGTRRTRAVPIDACVDASSSVAGESAPVDDAGAPYGGVISPRRARTLSFAGATLEVPAGAVDRNVRVTVRPLGNEKLAPLGRLMTNVTPGGGVYRFGPHGTVFKKPVKLTLPVDPALIPEGMSPRDVQTYYYDEAHGRWVSLGRKWASRERVLAMTGHFTDFINATLAVPDHPDAQRFDPTTIKGMKLGAPGAGITLIEPPQADASGSARLHYPIETPAGRNGVQPELALNYDSERNGVDGWLGLGWDLSWASIEIDTRFGVPRYDGSETYLFDGALLVQNPDGTFRRRIEGRFDRIERVGTGPTDYHWVVTDKSGTVSTFGAAGGRLADPRTSPGNIFRWCLESMRDTFGNTMTVSYVHDPFTNGDQFDQIYPLRIDYTSNGSQIAAYHVDFVLDDGGTRPDVVITGRAGFPVATRRRLAEIRETFGPTAQSPATPVRAYEFEYNPNLDDTFNKSVLAAVSLRSDGANPATELYRHTFDYFKAPATDGMFAPQTIWGQFQQPDGSLRSDDGLNHATDQLFGASGSVGIGLFDFLSATVSAGGDTGDTTPNLAFIDANGDGLPDQMDNAGAASLNTLLATAPTAHFGEISFPGLGTVGHTNRSGWTVGGSLSALEGLFGVGASYSQHTAEDDQLISDMNGDGFPDLVTLDSGVVNVRLNTGVQQFAAPTPWNAFSLGGVTFSRQDRWNQAGQAGAFFPADPLIRWTAPFGGTINVDTTLTKVKSGGDGVRAELFFNNETAPRWTCSFSAGDLGPCTNSLTVTVAAGDRLYTKVDSLGDPSFDELTASLTVAYQVDSSVASQVEPYGAPIYRFNQAEDFRLAGLPSMPWTATAEGDVQATPCFTKISSADNITASVVHKRGNAVVETFELSKDAGDTGSFCLSGLQSTIHVLADDTLAFQVMSDSQIDPATVFWPASVDYQNYCRLDPRTRSPVCAPPVCAAGFCTIGSVDPLRGFPLPEGFIRAPADVFYPAFQWTAAAPAATRTFVATSSGTPEIKWNVSTSGPRIIVYVQGVNRLIAKAVLGSGAPSAHIDVSPSVASGEQLFFTAFFPDGQPANPATVSIGTPTVGASTALVNVRFPDPQLDNNGGGLLAARDPMSGGYHRWFYGDWNGSRTFDESRITLSSNPKSTDTFLYVTPAPFGLPARLSDLGPIPMWIGRGSGEFLAAGRINPAFSASGAASGKGAGVNALRVSDTWNVDLQATVVGLNAGINAGDSTTDIDLLDLNGDRFPDSVTSGGVQFNDGVGAFTGRAPIDMGFDDVRSTTNASLRFGIDLGVIGQLINLANSRSKTAKHVSTSVASASTDYGVSSTRVDFADVNGDGLLDHVARHPDDPGLRVRLNLGYGFSKEILWSGPAWQRGEIPASFLTFSSGNIASDAISGALGVVPGNPTSTNAVRFQDSQTNNLSVGTPGQTFGAGGGPNASLTRQIVDLIDLNGDGLPDQVMRAPDEDKRIFRVKLNRGDHFGPETQWSIPDWTVDNSLPAEDLLANPDGVGYSTLAGWAASVHFQFCFVVCVGGSAFYSRDNGGSNMTFEDVDGDGKPDQVLKIVDDPNVYVKLNQTGKTNLLKAVHRPLGGTITLDYQRVGNRVDHTASPTVDMPSNQWAIASVQFDSGQPASQPAPGLVQTIDFSANGAPDSIVGFYDRVERENFGYANVKTSFPQEGTSVAREYLNQDYYRKGLPSSAAWNQFDAGGVVQTLKREVYGYADPSGNDPAAQPAHTGTLFPAPRDTDTVWLEADPGGRSKVHRQTETYDATGNLTDVVDVGDVGFGDPTDDFNHHIDYVHPDPAGLITKPGTITTRTGQNQTGALLRQRIAAYFPTGKPRTITDTIAGGKDPATGAPRTESAPAFATWTFTYDGFANVATAIGPEGHAFEYAYDAETQTYRTFSKDDSLQYASVADYDKRFGLAKAITDVDGAREDEVYDDFGRVTQVFGPKDFDANGVRTTPSLTFNYSEQPHAAAGFVEVLPASAITGHKNVAPPEMSRPGDPIPTRAPIRTITFVDGLQRILQTKKDITHDDGSGTTADGMSVSGVVIFDSRGRIYQQGQPVFRAASTDFVGDVPMLNPTTFAYDVLSRERQMTRPDASSVDAAAHGNQAVKTTSYQLGTLDGKLLLLKLVQDPRGEVLSTYRSVRDEVVAVDEVNKIGGVDNVHLVTRYAYDPLSQLVTVTDAKENVTTAAYDTVGKMVALASPDAGRTEWRHDRAGNQAVKETANLRAAGQLIRYVYNADRLEQITYPTSTPVVYTYGSATETGPANGFVAGRVKRRVDESGEIDFRYDGLGDVVQETTLLVNLRQPNKGPTVNTMTYSHDSFGRMLEMQFPGPGAEIVRYGYDAGGEVTSVRGLNTVSKANKPPLETVYLQHMGYDEFEQRTRHVAGNGIPTTYAYEADTRRLSQVNTDYRDHVQVAQGIGPLPMQRLRYAYDMVGNIRTLANAVPSQSNDGAVVVGPTSFSFDYDRLYQLTRADGTYQDHLATRLRHSVDLAYDGIGNIVSKNQQDFQDTGGSGGSFQPGPARPQTTYLLGYQYAGTGPHTVSHIDEARQGNLTTPRDVSHDLDGNQVGWTFRNGTQRVETWNEEDRLRQVKDQGHVIGNYLYNADGTRTHSFADGDETIHPSQFLSIKNGMFFTQHIYAGDERIASKVNADSLNNPSTLWYHPDHLQSTQFVSVADQTLVQHIEYFASGETWKEESTDALEPVRPAYQFSGKELDTKTGFYYFGARYYDPQIQNWQSTDPMLASYVKTGGITLPRNLGLYSYSWNNPLVIRDPDGRKIVFAKNASPEFKAEFQRAVTYLKNHGASKMIDDLQSRPEEITLVEISGGNAVYHSDKRSIDWNPHSGAWATSKGGKRSPANKLSHEADHAMADLTDHENYLKRKEDKTDNRPVWKNAEEKRVIEGYEKELAKKTGEGARKSHWSENYTVEHADESEPADKNAKPPKADEK